VEIEQYLANNFSHFIYNPKEKPFGFRQRKKLLDIYEFGLFVYLPVNFVYCNLKSGAAGRRPGKALSRFTDTHSSRRGARKTFYDLQDEEKERKRAGGRRRLGPVLGHFLGWCWGAWRRARLQPLPRAPARPQPARNTLSAAAGESAVTRRASGRAACGGATE